jgi:hypothetical protein
MARSSGLVAANALCREEGCRIEPVGAFHGILPHVTNIDNRPSTTLIRKCSLLYNNIPIATHTRNSTAPSLLWYGLVNSAQQRMASSIDPIGVLYWVRLKTSTELYVDQLARQLGPVQTVSSRQDLQGSSVTKKCLNTSYNPHSSSW